jgi:hypothetical protein
MPEILVPAFLVPLFLMLHITSLLQARRAAGVASGESVPPYVDAGRSSAMASR